MKGDPDVIKKLNQILTNELTSINQYFLHARMYQNEGYGKLGKKTYEESIEEMNHADRLVNRILFLDGLPNLQALHKLKIGTTVEERLNADLALETGGRAAMVEAIALCEEKQDYVTRDLLTKMLDDTEEHIDFLETQLLNLEQLGLQNYLQSQYELESAAGAGASKRATSKKPSPEAATAISSWLRTSHCPASSNVSKSRTSVWPLFLAPRAPTQYFRMSRTGGLWQIQAERRRISSFSVSNNSRCWR